MNQDALGERDKTAMESQPLPEKKHPGEPTASAKKAHGAFRRKAKGVAS